MRALIVLCCLAFGLAGAHAQTPELGLRDTTGRLWRLADFKAETTLVYYWATWCASCKKVTPILEKLSRDSLAAKLQVLGVSVDEDLSALRSELRARPRVFPVLIDADMAAMKRWGVKAVPTIFLIRDGKIVKRWTGPVSEAELKRAIRG